MTNRERIGVFGGTFDPIHIGHLVAAQNAQYSCALDRVLLMVAGEPWQKSQHRDVTDADIRFAAVSDAVEGVPGLEASRLEIDRPGPSYTADTLHQLHAMHPEADLFLILGTDAAAKVTTWTSPEMVASLAELVIVDRAGSTVEDSRPLPEPWKVTRVAMPALNISSTDLRQRLKDGRPVDFLIPQKAMERVRAGWGYDRGERR